jgi:alpha-beta hydrolase superfamily lysophospholipase
MLRTVDLHNCEGFSVYAGDQRKLGRVAHVIYGSDLETPAAVAVVRHGLIGTQTEVIPVTRIDLINPVTQIIQLRDE